MKRRGLLQAGCACGLLGLFGRADAQEQPWSRPPRFDRPDVTSDEGGLWATMDRAETQLRRSPFAVRDKRLVDYVQGIACRLGGDHCPSVRVYLVDNPLVNASMAPNGMMQVWTGLLLRMDSEAQLAAVLGHEIGHYLARHSVERLRDVKARAGFAQFLSIFGLVGLVGQIATIASLYAYSRDQEREADRIGLALMQETGYDSEAAGDVWANFYAEIEARPESRRSAPSPMFATHPAMVERRDELQRLAVGTPSGATNGRTWEEMTAPFRMNWLAAEVKRGQHEEAIALLTRKIGISSAPGDYLFSRAEVYRSRGTESDLDLAIADYVAAQSSVNPTPEAYRGLGFIYRGRNQPDAAGAALRRYLELAPDVADASMIKHYLQEIGK